MSDHPTLDERYGDSEVLAEFSLPESKALIDLALLVMMVDREITDAELDALHEQIGALPFATRGQAEAALSDHMDRAQRTIATLLDNDNDRAVHSYVDSATQRIQVQERRRKTLEVLSLLSNADEPVADETEIYFRVGAAFGFSDDQLDEIWLAGTAAL